MRNIAIVDMPGKRNDKLVYELHAQVCSVLSNAKRLEIIDLLRHGERTAGELCRRMSLSKANVSQQLSIMRAKGILLARREGRNVFYRLSQPRMLKAYDLLREVLLEKLEAQGTIARGLRGGGTAMALTGEKQ
ncbi:MAG: helix-turn-helix transcriptional regulator [Elusimicrobia bacterium]|nr:helix-turn-helix transcriptional regulator [Elusimicrobiota bacterium]